MLSKRGQVTVFIIIGLILFAAGIGLLVLQDTLEKARLGETTEGVFDSIFEKEGLRLFIEDCLLDSVEEALILTGEEGRLWKETRDGNFTGGTVSFVEGENGKAFANYRVYYGITNTNGSLNESLPYAYPCATEINDAPAYCKWKFGQTASFGTRQRLGIASIQGDLEKYVAKQSLSCMEEYFVANLSLDNITVLEDELDFDLEIENDGIQIKGKYPLIFVNQLTGEEKEQEVEFDYFYHSSIRDFIISAVSFPLNLEHRNATYNITQSALSRSDVYRQLAINLSVQEDRNTGDHLYEFHAPRNTVLRNRDFTFRYAVQNRPPALSYVERNECRNGQSGYDVLLLNVDPRFVYTEFSTIVQVVDPDGDEWIVQPNNPTNPLGLNFDPVTLELSGTAPFTSGAGATYEYVLEAHELDHPNMKDIQSTFFMVDGTTVPDLGCFGQNELTRIYPGYILEELTRYIRLGFDPLCINEPSFVDSSDLAGNELRCGFNTDDFCRNIAAECQGELAWELVENSTDPTNNYWCHGQMGCQSACYDGIIYLGDDFSVFSSLSLNEVAKIRRVFDDNVDSQRIFNFACGSCANPDYEGLACDENRNRDWGICGGGVCVSD